MDENQKLVYDLLKEVRADQKTDSKKISATEACVSSIKDKLEEVERNTDENTKGLQKHMSRTEIAEKGLDILTDLHKDNQDRIKNLEEDSKKKAELLNNLRVEKEAKKWLKDNLKYWLAIAVLVAGLISKMTGLW